jgi:hypothetical protein
VTPADQLEGVGRAGPYVNIACSVNFRLWQCPNFGYSPEEIKDAFEVELVQWVRQRQSTAASHPTQFTEPKANLVLQKGGLLGVE